MMKNIYRLALIAFTLLMLASCSPDDAKKMSDALYVEKHGMDVLDTNTGQLNSGANVKECPITVSDVFSGPSNTGIDKYLRLTVPGTDHNVVRFVIETIIGDPSDIGNNGQIFDQAAEVYGKIIGGIQEILLASVVVALLLYLASVALGIAKPHIFHILVMLIKFVIIMILLSPGGWGYFNASVIKFFDGFVVDVINITAQAFGDTDILDIFDSVGDQVAQFLNAKFGMLMVATYFDPEYIGTAYTLILCVMIYTYLLMILGVVKSLLITFLARYCLYGVAPFFLIFLLFNQTASLFKGWLEQVISFSLQAVFIFAFLGIINSVLGGFIMATFDTASTVPICWREFKGFGGVNDTGSTMYAWQLGETGYPGPDDLPFEWWPMVIVTFLVIMLNQMMKWSAKVSSRIAGGLLIHNPQDALANPISGVDFGDKSAWIARNNQAIQQQQNGP